MFGGYLSGPDDGRPAIERAAAEKTKELLASLIRDGGLGHAIPDTVRNERKISGALLACWSLVHGLTQLIADGLVGPGKKADELCREPRAGNARRLGGRIAGIAPWNLGRPSDPRLIV